jgi:glycosyltransferase involved in cell wall biosynthesis
MSAERSKTSRPLRIAQVAPLWMSIPPAGYGGTEMVVHLLTEGLVRRGHEVTLFGPGDSKTSARLHAVGERSVTALMGEGRAHVYDHYANAALSDAVRLAERFDVIHCHLDASRLPLAAIRQADRVAGRVVFTLHTCPTPDDAWVLSRYPDVPVVTASRFQASLVPAGRTVQPRVINHGIDLTAYPFCERPGKYLAFVGRMSEQKGPLNAIATAKAAGIPLFMAGRPQNTEEEVYFETRVKPLIDGQAVRYIGPVDHRQKIELLAGAAALLFPITGHESFGLIVVEAMACGTPVVATSVASAPELIDVGVTGFHALAVAELPALVRRAVDLDRGVVRQTAEKRFSQERMIGEYERLYAELCCEGARP